MEIVKKTLEELNLNPKSLKDFKVNIPNKKPFKIENLKEWFGGQRIHVVAMGYKGLKNIPYELEGTPALKVIDVLDRCWLSQGDVAEGMVGDLVYGCGQDVVTKMSPDMARVCITDLMNRGYICFSDEEGNTGEAAWTSLPISKIWFRITEKFSDVVVALPL